LGVKLLTTLTPISSAGAPLDLLDDGVRLLRPVWVHLADSVWRGDGVGRRVGGVRGAARKASEEQKAMTWRKVVRRPGFGAEANI
jgi:hypothetical protein